MAIGVVVFVVSKAEGKVQGSMFGSKIELEKPSLVIFLAGLFLFIFPFTPMFHGRESEEDTLADVNDTPANNSAYYAQDVAANLSEAVAAENLVPPLEKELPAQQVTRPPDVIVSEPQPARAEVPADGQVSVEDSGAQILDQAWLDRIIAQNSR